MYNYALRLSRVIFSPWSNINDSNIFVGEEDSSGTYKIIIFNIISAIRANEDSYISHFKYTRNKYYNEEELEEKYLAAIFFYIKMKT